MVLSFCQKPSSCPNVGHILLITTSGHLYFLKRIDNCLLLTRPPPQPPLQLQPLPSPLSWTITNSSLPHVTSFSSVSTVMVIFLKPNLTMALSSLPFFSTPNSRRTWFSNSSRLRHLMCLVLPPHPKNLTWGQGREVRVQEAPFSTKSSGDFDGKTPQEPRPEVQTAAFPFASCGPCPSLLLQTSADVFSNLHFPQMCLANSHPPFQMRPSIPSRGTSP